ncbi:MAG: phosphoglucosamine mutase [Bacteroidales bacterium]|jgi:phosphomannomutase|nr:phosphoglucosamine mutase [Bacteroidales bacterium]
MSLIKSISGIRGTVGGRPGEGLSPLDAVKFAAAYAQWLAESAADHRLKVVVGRDARLSGPMINALVGATLTGMGCDVIDIGLATTPTTEIAVTGEQADGGIIITASHNPRQWNALKLLNSNGEFLSAADGARILELADKSEFNFATVDLLGTIVQKDYLQEHILRIIALPLVDVAAIRDAGFAVAFDAVNSVGGIALPPLLEALGVNRIAPLNAAPTGDFAHMPEPLPENLTEVCATVKKLNVDVCFVVDPDVDRLSIIDENGAMFNEEYTLVAVADFVLSRTPGPTVSNLSSSRALREITYRYGQHYAAAAVGEVNVVTKMKEINAIIGGEGNGGIIYPALHYGRDSLVGIALFLTHLALSRRKCSELRTQYPDFFMSKNKIELTPDINVDTLLERIALKYADENVTAIDGVKIDFAEGWVHLRKSNTEPIIRIYAESTTPEKAAQFAEKIIADIRAATEQ